MTRQVSERVLILVLQMPMPSRLALVTCCRGARLTSADEQQLCRCEDMADMAFHVSCIPEPRPMQRRRSLS